jgi:hypothetical protein
MFVFINPKLDISKKFSLLTDVFNVYETNLLKEFLSTRVEKEGKEDPIEE